MDFFKFSRKLHISHHEGRADNFNAHKPPYVAVEIRSCRTQHHKQQYGGLTRAVRSGAQFIDSSVVIIPIPAQEVDTGAPDAVAHPLRSDHSPSFLPHALHFHNLRN